MAIQLIAGMRELAPRYDGFILDLWGVIHDGVRADPRRPRMPAVVDRQRASESSCCRMRRAAPTTSSGESPQIGVPGGLYHHVMSSGEEAWQHLHRRDDPFYAALGRRCLHIGSERDLEIREGLGPRICR